MITLLMSALLVATGPAASGSLDVCRPANVPASGSLDVCVSAIIPCPRGDCSYPGQCGRSECAAGLCCDNKRPVTLPITRIQNVEPAYYQSIEREPDVITYEAVKECGPRGCRTVWRRVQ